MRWRRAAASTFLFVTLAGIAVLAAPLKPHTAQAFAKYVAETERQAAPSLASADRFLWIDVNRPNALASLREGVIVVEKLETKFDGKPLDVRDGMIHHWLASGFVKGVTVDRALTILQDFDRHAEYYKPSIAQSKLLERKGDMFKVHLRFYTKKIITVVINSDHEAVFMRPAPGRASNRMVSTRIAEVENFGKPDEKEKPVDGGDGYLWRLNTYWRFLERDGGLYIQCESISLTREPPFLLRLIIQPFIGSIPKEQLTSLFQATRRVLAAS
jgi:hypothetical protein